MLLFRCLDELAHAVVRENGEGTVQQVLPPFFNGGGDGGEFSDIRGCTKKPRAERFTKEGYWVVLLGQDCSHADTGGVSLDAE